MDNKPSFDALSSNKIPQSGLRLHPVNRNLNEDDKQKEDKVSALNQNTPNYSPRAHA